MERVNKVIARAGIVSRKKAEELIRQGRVRVNEVTAVIGQQVDPDDDVITVDGKPIRIERKVYYVFYKPKGAVTTMGEEHGQPMIAEFPKVRALKERAFPVGRLDKEAEGLLLLTNDGGLANRLSHPRYEMMKECRVRLDRPLGDVEKLQAGVMVDGRHVGIGGCRSRGKEVVLSIHEGRKHIVKRVFRELGYTVIELKRTRIGPVRLGKLKPGEIRSFRREELE